MTYSLRDVSAFVFASIFLAGTGCQQGLGDRCQLNTDCSAGLTCVIPAGISAAVGGTCEGSIDGGFEIDLAGPGDASQSSADLPGSADLPSSDQATSSDLSGDLSAAADLSAVANDLAPETDLHPAASDSGHDAAPVVDARSGG